MLKVRSLIKFVVVLVMLAFAVWIFYNKRSFIDKFLDKYIYKNKYEVVISAEPTVKGDYDVATSTNRESVVNKYNFPVANYTPTRKPQALDLNVWRAHASVILDAESGTILHYENGKEERQIASLTKIMTAVLVIENIKDLDNEIVTIDEEAVYADGTKIGCPSSGNCIGNRLKIGEKISARSLLKAMLMNSANDSAIALGKHIAGTQDKFAQMMNDRAREMGLKNTNFCTASGLEIEGREKECYSSAYDIARIAAFSMRYKTIWDTFVIRDTKVYSADETISHDIMNTNRLLDEMPECLGTKTGFTPLAGKSLMLAAEDKTKKHKIIAVVLNDPYMWEDIKEMTHWAFDSYVWQ
jgi:D-alanyl-D-alanine carboxypeptidase